MVGLQTLDLAIGVRVPASQPHYLQQFRAVVVVRARLLFVLWGLGTDHQDRARSPLQKHLDAMAKEQSFARSNIRAYN